MREKETLIVKLDKYVCILYFFSYSPLFMHTHFESEYLHTKEMLCACVCAILFASFIIFSCSLTRLMVVYCMHDAFFITPKKKREYE